MGVIPSQAGGFVGPGLDPNTPIYRIYPQRFLDDLLEGKFVIRSTRTWTDPYEKLISLCCYATVEDGRIKQHSIENNWLPTFGQCWSTCRDSNATWRIYSSVHQDGFALDLAFDVHEAVRLRTTVNKLLNCVAASLGSERSKGCFIAINEIFRRKTH
jgi:hypothetical protein